MVQAGQTGTTVFDAKLPFAPPFFVFFAPPPPVAPTKFPLPLFGNHPERKRPNSHPITSFSANAFSHLAAVFSTTSANSSRSPRDSKMLKSPRISFYSSASSCLLFSISSPNQRRDVFRLHKLRFRFAQNLQNSSRRRAPSLYSRLPTRSRAAATSAKTLRSLLGIPLHADRFQRHRRAFLVSASLPYLRGRNVFRRRDLFAQICSVFLFASSSIFQSVGNARSPNPAIAENVHQGDENNLVDFLSTSDAVGGLYVSFSSCVKSETAMHR